MIEVVEAVALEEVVLMGDMTEEEFETVSEFGIHRVGD